MVRVGPLAVDDFEEPLLDRPGHRAARPGADLDPVHRPDRRDFGGRSHEEQLVGHVERLALDRRLPDLVAKVARDRDDRIPRDAGQHRRVHRRRVQDPPAHHEDVLRASLAHVAVDVERDPLGVPVGNRLHLDQLAARVVRHRLRHRRERIRSGAGPRADAHVHALLQRFGSEVGAPLPAENCDIDGAAVRADAQLAVAAIHERADVARLEVIGPDRVENRLVERLWLDRDRHAVDLRRVVQAGRVRVEPEAGGALRRAVAARALEHAAPVVNHVRADVDRGIGPVHERPVHPDHTSAGKRHISPHGQ